MSSADPDALVFQAILTPYRSLSRRGAVTVVGLLLTLTLLLGLRFLLWGAWPVIIFSSAEVPLVTLLLMLNFRSARESETVLLSGTECRILQTNRRGQRREIKLPTAWLRVSLQQGTGASRIELENRKQRLEVGAFLHEADRRALYEALRDAVFDVHHPTFDNPQLQGLP